MPAGIQGWDGAGSQQFSITDRIPRAFGSVRTTANQAGSISHGGFSTGEPYGLAMATRVTYGSTVNRYPTISFNGNTMSWTAAPEPMIIAYGVK